MPTPDSSVPLVAKCVPRLVETPERCGGLTVCDIKQTTIADFDALYRPGGEFRVDHVILEADFVGKACQAKQNGWYDFLAATRRQGGRARLRSGRNKSGQMIYEPFIRMERENPINNNFWQLVYVSGPTTAGTPPVTTYIYDLTSATGIPTTTGWFPPKMRIFISSVNKETGTKVDIQAEVVSATINAGKIRVVVKPAQAGSAAPAATMDWPTAAGPVAANGVVTRGTANINDYEADCPQLPALNTMQEAYFWVEYGRYGLCENDLTKQYMALLIEGNPLYKRFYSTPDIVYNRQVTEDWQARLVNQFLFGKASSPNQTASDWNTLPQITLSTHGQSLPWEGACIGYKADSVGVFDQLHECQRVWDLQRQPLDLPMLFQYLYEIKRVREANNIEVKVIELGMDSQFALQFQTAMIRYFNMRGEGLLRLNMSLDAAGAQGDWGFWFYDYILDFPAGLRLRVVTHPLWDDLIDAHRASYVDSGAKTYDLSNSASQIWIIDWATTYQEIIESNKVTNTTGTVEELARVNAGFGCVMKVPSFSYRLNSLGFAAIMECPKANLLIKNFDRCTVPTHTGGGCGNAFMSIWDPTTP